MKKLIKKLKKYFNKHSMDTRKMSQGKQEFLLRILCR